MKYKAFYVPDEVLGISTKRLLSIISNTQCPDQTDSEECSDEEDCVLEKDAHVSLEEITDSEDDLQNEQKIGKLRQKLLFPTILMYTHFASGVLCNTINSLFISLPLNIIRSCITVNIKSVPRVKFKSNNFGQMFIPSLFATLMLQLNTFIISIVSQYVKQFFNYIVYCFVDA